MRIVQYKSLVIGILAAVALLGAVAACGDDDDAADVPTEGPDTTLSAGDEEAVDQAIAEVIAAMKQRSVDAITPLVTEDLAGRANDLEKAATCFPEDGVVEVASREIRPRRENDVNVAIDFTVTTAGETDDARRDWSFERQEDGSLLLAAPPQCPFRPAQPSATEAASPTGSAEETTSG